MQNQKSPIAIFCFNRPWHLSQTLEALKQNPECAQSDLYVFCDGARNVKELPKVKEVHAVIDQISGFKSITIKKQEINQGLANSIIAGVSEVLNKHEDAIILEDDIVVSRNFLKFMNDGLEFYEGDERVFSVTGFNYSQEIYNIKSASPDVFAIKGRNSSWSWAIWKNRWNKIDFSVKDFEQFKNNEREIKNFNKIGDNLFEMLKLQMTGKIDSWAIRASYHCFKNNLYTIFPVRSFTKNIGLEGEGTHFSGKIDDSLKHLIHRDLNQNNKIIFQKLDELKKENNFQNTFLKYSNKRKKLFSKKTISRLKYFALGLIIGASSMNLINIFQ